jgi:hypothetical protein
MNTQTIYDTIKTLDQIKKRAIYINNLMATHDNNKIVTNGLCIIDPKLLHVELNEFNVRLTYQDNYWGNNESWIIENELFDMCEADIVYFVQSKINTHKITRYNTRVNVLQHEAKQLGYELIKKGE